jgi:hypothetical protein
VRFGGGTGELRETAILSKRQVPLEENEGSGGTIYEVVYGLALTAWNVQYTFEVFSGSMYLNPAVPVKF